MNTCKDCKWWGDHFVPMNNVDFSNLFKWCDYEVGADRDRHFYALEYDRVSIKFDASEQIATGPDFGCIHHEPKEGL